MKVPLSWLREYVDFDDDAQGLAEKLTFSGIEVEGIERVREGLANLVVGEILEVKPHPKADRLKLCTVDGGDGSVAVVCGADNMSAGDKAAFAPVGCSLPNGMTIKKAKLRGEESFGMLLAEDELGLSEDHAGILLLDNELVAGTPLSKVLGEPDDVLDLEITWNRADCLSIIGIAREVAALYGSSLKLPEADLVEGDLKADDKISVEIKDVTACPRYTGRYLDSIKLGPSPDWMQSRLLACGIRPISNVVDITNYVMLETGHPLHAFDYRHVADGDIIVRFADKGEKMKTLDGIDRQLTDELLLIADKDKALAVAGVMGGEGSEIQDDTTEVLLESAAFAPPVIHRAVATLALMSESSHRFERYVDFEWVDFASRRACRLMVECAGAAVAAGVVDVSGGAPKKRVIDVSMETITGVIGIELDKAECSSILSSLEFGIEENDSGFSVTVPEFRSDVVIEADLVEEIARIKGLDAVPAVLPSCVSLGSTDDTRPVRREAIRDQLIALGLMETVSYSFMSRKLAAMRECCPGVELPNPVSADYCVMRGSLLPQMTDLLGRNLAHQSADCACFEIGKTFSSNEGNVEEAERIAIGLMGHCGRKRLDRMSKVTDEEMFLWCKGLVEALFSANGKEFHLEPAEVEMMEQGASVEILVEGAKVGIMGLLASSMRDNYRISGPVALAEIDLETIVAEPLVSGETSEIPAYPAILRDIAVVVEECVLHADICRTIESIDCPELTGIQLFDIFRGRGTGDGRKSMAYSLTFQSSKRTLTDEEANGFRDRIRDGLISKLNAEIREG